MKKSTFTLLVSILCLSTNFLYGQNNVNCFLEDFQPKVAKIPISVPADRIVDVPTVNVILSGDTIRKISRYIFGNAIAVWMGNVTSNATFVKNTRALAPTLIRFPGGSWSDIFFWNGRPTDIPDSLFDGTTNKKTQFTAISGKGDWSTTVDNYYKLREQVGTQGLITINYGYARYGTSSNPVAAAAHLAANWVRYDKGRTKFWEIGNEDAGPWEAGYMIDIKTNKDAQPKIITGQLYGQHFKVFVDSMRAAATQIGAKIAIGGQVLHYDGTTSWNNVDKTWNSGFFNAIGDAADFYVMHNYFGSAATVDNLVTIALTEPKKNIDFIRQDIAAKKAFAKPVALTEYNMNGGLNTPDPIITKINGLQEVVLFNELIKNNFGLSARWLLATGENGMFYQGTNNSLLWQARPEFYYAYYLQLFTGDHMISATSNNTAILAYSTKFASGETGVIVVNRTKTNQVVNVKMKDVGVGNQYYVYSLTGGTDKDDFSLFTYVNGVGPTGTQWGPRENLETIPANAYPISDSIKVNSPGLSVQFIMVEAGNNILNPTIINNLKIDPRVICFPNPFTESTTIKFQMNSTDLVTIDVYNKIGIRVATLINKTLTAGKHSVQFDARYMPAGVYICKLQIGNSFISQKMVLNKNK